jgi:hypothetical protein
MASDKSNAGPDELAKHLPADLALLFTAIRAEFDAKLDSRFTKLQYKVVMMGVPLGAVGGLFAELAKPGSVTGFIPFL